MNIVAAIVLIGATGHAERAITVEDQQIAGIVARVIGRVVSDVRHQHEQRERGRDHAELFRTVSKIGPKLTIDGKPRTGWRSWAEAAVRIGAYAADCRDDGSVCYSYRLHVRGYLVRRATQIQDGRVILTTDAWWVETVPVLGRITRRVPIHVCITIRADEDSNGTTQIVGTVTGTANTSDFRCGLVRRIAERQASETLRIQLPAVLRTIQQRGTDYYLGSADLGPVLDGIGEAMRGVGPRLGRLR
jgi:hypothetical protein